MSVNFPHNAANGHRERSTRTTIPVEEKQEPSEEMFIPETLTRSRYKLVEGKIILPVLVKWLGFPYHEATWEDIRDYEVAPGSFDVNIYHPCSLSPRM